MKNLKILRLLVQICEEGEVPVIQPEVYEECLAKTVEMK